MSMREFTTAVKESPSSPLGVEPVTFTVDGEEWTAYPPTGGQLALVMAAQSEHADPVEKVAGLINFLDGILDDDARSTYRSRLLDRDDPFDIEDVEGIIEWLVEGWSARPTQPPSASRSSRRRGGPKSTATRPSVAATS